MWFKVSRTSLTERDRQAMIWLARAHTCRRQHPGATLTDFRIIGPWPFNPDSRDRSSSSPTTAMARTSTAAAMVSCVHGGGVRGTLA
jgi:hypothetical protein